MTPGHTPHKKRTAWPWLILGLAAVAAFISDYSGPDVGLRVMLLLITAAIITAIQDHDACRTTRPSRQTNTATK